jgi:hypothetical protein
MVADERSEEMKRVVLMALGVVLALALASPMAFAQVEQRAQASGASGELAAAWWQWALSKPAADNPLFEGDPNYSDAQCNGEPVTATPDETWFLAGLAGTAAVERTCTMPAGSQLFFPVVTQVFVFTDPNKDTDAQARESASGFINNLLADPDFEMTVTVDGKEINNNRIVRAETPFFQVQLPKKNVFGVPAREYRAFADGLWVTLRPLPPGEHTIQWEMSAPNAGFSQDVTYHLTVE